DKLTPHVDDPRVAAALAASRPGEPVEELARRLDALGDGVGDSAGVVPAEGRSAMPRAALWPEPGPRDTAYAHVYRYVIETLDRLADDATIEDLDKATAAALDEILDVASRLRSGLRTWPVLSPATTGAPDA